MRDLAEKSGVHRNTIRKMEADEAKHGPTISAVVQALEKAGVVFTNGDEPGVKLKKKKSR